MLMEPRLCGRKRRLLVVTATLAIRDSCGSLVPASLPLPLVFSPGDAGWTGSAAIAPAFSFSDSSSAHASPTPSWSSHTGEPTVSSRTPSPGIEPDTEDLTVSGDSDSRHHSDAGDFSASFDADEGNDYSDGSTAAAFGGPEESPAIITTPVPTGGAGVDADGGLESITSPPTADESPPPDHLPVMRFPTSPTPVGPSNPGEEAETPSPTPAPTQEDTESPPPPRNVLGSTSSRLRLTTSPPPTNGGKSGSDAVDGRTNPTGATTPSTSTPSSSALPSQEDRTAASSVATTIGSSSPQAPAPISITSTSTPEPTRRFQRGDDVIVIVQASSGSGGHAKTKSVVVSPSQSPALVVRSDQASSSSSSITSTSSADSSSSDVYVFVKYLTSITALLSLLWLVVSSILAASSSVPTPSWQLGDPNQWEFGVFVVHIQSLGSLSHMIATSATPAFALRYVDAFSWTVFVPFHGSAAGIGDSRRLDAVMLDGIVAFADRIGVNEANLLSKSVAGFVVLLAVVGVVVGVTYIFVRKHHQPNPGPITEVEDVETTRPVEALASRPGDPDKLLLWIAVGMFVLLWQFALYPLTLLGSYEISMELQSTEQVRGGPLALAVLTLGFVCLGGLIAGACKVWKLNSREKMAKPNNVAVWGSLYDGLRVQHRLFFVAFAASQVFRAVVIGSVVNGTVQVSLLLAMDVVVLAAVFWLRPFQTATLMKYFVITFVCLRILTTALAFAFTGSASSSARHRIATALVVIHATVLLLWFARHFGMACRQIRLQFRSRRTDTEKTPLSASTPQEPENHATPQASAYASLDSNQRLNERRGPGAPYSSVWDDSM